MKSLWQLCLVFLGCIVFGIPAQALTGEWHQKEQGQARLIASDQAESGKLYLGLQLKLAPHWHAYWRSPGDAGVPPQLDWKDSVNFKSATMLYPLPTLYSLQGLQTYGYEDEVVFPLLVEKTDPAAGLKLKQHLSILLCSDICVPVIYDLALDVPAGFSASTEATDLLKTWLAKVPTPDNGSGLTMQSASMVTQNGVSSIQVTYSSPQPVTEADLIVEVGDGAVVPVTNINVTPTMIEAKLGPDAQLKDIAGKDVVFTLVDKTNKKATEKKILLAGEAPEASLPPLPNSAPQVAPDDSSAPAKMVPHSLAVMILFALIGGLILNLMPCVLPVIALKALSFASHGGGTPAGVRASFLVTSAGIIFSFVVMASALIVLKKAGMSVGWGIQFQNPDFLIFLMAVLLLFAANLWGMFEITLPRVLADKLSWTHGHGNLLKDFLSGAFATLLATPCSAPFLGAAVSFALAGKSIEIMAIFVALGIGLAAPFLIIAIYPRAATLLPKPGKWMNTLKRVLAIFLLLTAVWVAYVLSMSFMMKMNSSAEWQEFREEQIPSLVSQGKTVFVDVTAAWCLTCQANARFVLERQDVWRELAAPGVVLMKADWTKPSEVIGEYLRRHGRYGIPFNIVYGPSAKDGVVLPELLTKNIVLEGLKKAR